jgi:predicted ATPase
MIHRFHVQNFKSIIDVTVDLSSVTVLVGRSGTGKSNFVQSLQFLRDLLLSADRQQDALLQNSWLQLRPAVSTEAPTRFEVEFSIMGIEERFRYILSLDKEGLDVPLLEERLQLGEKCLFHQMGMNQNKRPGMGRHQSSSKWQVAPELLQVPEPGPIALGRIPSISEIVIAFTALTSAIGCYSFSDKALCPNEKHRSRRELDPQTVGLDDEATNYLDVLKEIVSNLQDLNIRRSIVGALQRVNLSVSSVELNDIRQPSHVVVGHKYNGKTLQLQLSQESGGFRRFYSHLLALYQSPPKQTLIFEHPEDGIHPGALSILAEEFKAAPDNGRGQVILTTHNPKLLDHFNAEQIRVVELDGFQTKIGPVSTAQKEAIHEKLLYPGELLTVDPARIQREGA